MLIDTVIIVIALMVPLSFIYGQQYWQGDQFIRGFWDLLLGYIVPIVATIWFWLRFMGTPGKMALKLRVVDARTGNKLSLGQAIGRYFAYILSMLPFGIGFIWIGIDRFSSMTLGFCLSGNRQVEVVVIADADQKTRNPF
jgi:uncharacterized RDD family membrane protein YckC